MTAELKLKSADGELFIVEQDVIRCSLTIKTMLEDLGLEDGDEEVWLIDSFYSSVKLNRLADFNEKTHDKAKAFNLISISN